MKKNVLALSIAAMIGGLGFAGAASAVVINGTGATPTAAVLGATNATAFELTNGGVGHNLIVPYFTAQDGNMTVLHLTNTDVKNGKAVKVRFRGAANSDDILDFQVLLSPGDVWTGAVTAGADGVAQLTTADGTCTVPTLTKGVAQSFDTRRLQGSLSAADKAAGTREGYVEIFNMADIPDLDVYGSPAGKSALFKAIKHVGGVAPCTASVIDTALLETNYTEPTAAAAGFATPTTGLMGDWYIINVAKTTTFSGGATALTAVSAAGVAGRGNFVLFPQLSASVGSPDAFTADPALRTVPANVGTTKVVGGAVDPLPANYTLPVVEAAYYDLPDLSTPYLVPGTTAISSIGAATQAELLTKQLSVKSITNQYANDASITAKTDWVFSMPTRRYSVAMDYRADAPVRVFTPGILNGTAFFYTGNTAVDAGKICVNSDGQSFFDREETTKSSGAVFSPGSVDKTRFCGETSVLSFADAGTSVLGATVARQDTGSSAYVNGWSVISTTNGGAGLPILGSSFIKLTNPQASAGMSGTYGITWPHRFTK